MGMSYELERQPFRQFMTMAKAIEAARVAAELELQLLAYKALQASDALDSKRSLVPKNILGLLISTNQIFHKLIRYVFWWDSLTCTISFIRFVTLDTRFVLL
jgi:hypothetical protein